MTSQNTPLRGEDIRQKNEKIILRAIQHHGALSQSDVVGLTGLKAPTVLRIFSILEEQLLIKVAKGYVSKNTEKKGRKPVYYQVIPTAHYVIGLEFWSQTAHVMIVDFTKQEVYADDILLPVGIDAGKVVDLLEDLIERSIQQSGIPRSAILGIGVGAPGRVQMDTGAIIRYARIPGFDQYPLAQELGRRFSTEVLITNNAGVIAMDSYRRGSARDSGALFTYFIRQGVGGAFITNGRLFSVLGKTAFEVGHTTAVADGRPCYCGSDGCLEAYISENGILESFDELGYGFSSMQEVDAALASGDEDVHRLIKELAKYLAVSAQNIFKILSPDGFLIITRFSRISEIFAEAVREQLSCDPYASKAEDLAVYSDAYSPREAGHGACDLIFDRFFSIS